MLSTNRARAVPVDTGRQAISRLAEIASDPVDPLLEEPGDAPSNRRVAFGELGGERCREASQAENRWLDEVSPGGLHDREDAFEWVGRALFGRPEDVRLEDVADMIDNRQQEVVLGREEVVETPTGGVRLLHDLVDTGLGVTLPPEELRRRWLSAVLECSFYEATGLPRMRSAQNN